MAIVALKGEIEMSLHILENEALRVSVADAGAELTSGATVASGVDGLCSFFAGVNVRYVAPDKSTFFSYSATCAEVFFHINVFYSIIDIRVSNFSAIIFCCMV